MRSITNDPIKHILHVIGEELILIQNPNEGR